MNSITINPDYLRGLCHVAADKDIRSYLNGVFLDIRPRDTRYVATNGHCLAIIRDEIASNEPDQVPAQIIIPRATCKAAKRAKQLMATLHYLDGKVPGEENPCKIEHLKDGAALHFQPLDGTFPDFARVIPTKVDGKPGAFNWDYLAAFNALTATAFDARLSVELYPNGVAGCALVMCGEHPGFLGAVMPVQLNNPDECPELPAWFTGRPDLKVAA